MTATTTTKTTRKTATAKAEAQIPNPKPLMIGLFPKAINSTLFSFAKNVLEVQGDYSLISGVNVPQRNKHLQPIKVHKLELNNNEPDTTSISKTDFDLIICDYNKQSIELLKQLKFEHCIFSLKGIDISSNKVLIACNELKKSFDCGFHVVLERQSAQVLLTQKQK